MKLGDDYYDCFVLLAGREPLAPGTTARVPIKLLSFDAIRQRLQPGVRFELWEGRVIGEGLVVKHIGK